VRVAQAVGQTLAALGVEHLFGVIGSGNFDVATALQAAGVRFVHARHECAAVCMADGYARVSGRVGVATCHQGPGLTNALTSLTEAAKARTPVLLLAADTSAAAVRSNFRIDQAAAVRACGGVVERVHSAATVVTDVHRAWRSAAGGRRAVALMLPLDVQAAEVTAPGPAATGPVVDPPAPAASAVARVVDLLAAARLPAIVAGRGAVLASAGAGLRRLGARIGAILATSANGNGLFAGDPWAVGISGGFAAPAAAELLASADLVLAFGASLNMWTTRHGALIGQRTRVVQVDVNSDAIGAHHRIDAAITADAALTADALLAELGHREVQQGFRSDDVAARIAAGHWRDAAYDDASTGDTIDPRTLSITLDAKLPGERSVTIDSGHFMGWPAMYLDVPDAAGFVFNQSFQSIGLGLGAAIGAAVARPDRLAVAMLGDGGAMMSLGELETAASLGEPLLVVVYNDAAYGAEVHHFEPMGRPVDLVRFGAPDLAAYGRAAGGHGITVRTPADLDGLDAWLAAPDGLCVVDARVTATVVAEWLEEAFRAH
jgi:thiamine pyrophosphate-dependent acetolactate synthase large subunit-like protein